MKEINTLLVDRSSVLFIAPTGWGKTTLILDLVLESSKSWVYLAPLRALANEFYLRASKVEGAYLISSRKDLVQIMKSSLDFKLLIITPELLTIAFLEKLNRDSIFVFDEIHLFFYWGDSFRPKLRDCYEDIMSLQFSSLFLTATMEKSLMNRWEKESCLNYDNSFILNLSNHKLKKDPDRIYGYPLSFKKNLIDEIESLKSSYVKLIFCPYREEVLSLRKELTQRGHKVLSCIGGETAQFSKELASCPYPEFIISTSALSHGVNLPKVSLVYISYRVKNYDFWVQMIGRAGRRGESFVVFTHDFEFLTKKHLIGSLLYLLFMKFKNIIYPYELRRYINS